MLEFWLWPEVEQLQRLNKQLRQWGRRRSAMRRESLEEPFREARHRSVKAEEQRFARLLAGQGVGVRKRLYLHLPTGRPGRVEVVEHLDPPQLAAVGDVLLRRVRPRRFVY